MAVSLLFTIPVIVWNVKHGLGVVQARRASDRSERRTLFARELLRVHRSQIAVVGPMLAVLSWWSRRGVRAAERSADASADNGSSSLRSASSSSRRTCSSSLVRQGAGQLARAGVFHADDPDGVLPRHAAAVGGNLAAAGADGSGERWSSGC